MSGRRSPVETARRLVLRSSAGRLGPLWRLAYALVARAAALELSRRYRATVLVRGAGADAQVVPGLSDIDLLAIAPPSVTLPEVLRVTWLGGMVQADLYRSDELALILGSTATTFGLESFGSAYYGPCPPRDATGLLDRPGLPPQPAGWRHLAGRRPVLPPTPPGDRQELREAAWREVALWWRFALLALHRADQHPSDAYLCVKLVAEPLRVLLALEGHDVTGRAEALEAGPSVAPELADDIKAAQLLLRSLPKSPSASLAETLPAFVSLTAKVAERIGSELPHGESVRLGAVGSGPGIPLADWRALIAEPFPCKRLVVRDGSPASADALVRASYPFDADVSALRSGPLLVEPTGDVWFTGRTRILQTWFTDPVTFALLDGSEAASFPAARGWSATDWARRAVAERRAWLRADGGVQGQTACWPAPPDAAEASEAAAAHMLASARVALFSLSLTDGDAVLLLDPDEVAAATGPEALVVRARIRAGEELRAAEMERFRARVVTCLGEARRAHGNRAAE